MYRTKILITLLLVTCAYAHAQLDPQSHAAVRKAMIANHKGMPTYSKLHASGKNLTAVVRVADENGLQQLCDVESYDVKPLRGPFAIVACSPEDAESLANNPVVRQCEFNRTPSLMLNQARRATGISQVHSGIELPQAYTGAGVLAGIVDIGFDPNHVNFTNLDGSNRIAYFFDMESTSTGNVRTTAYSSDMLASYITDDNTYTHGTHTLGIMAGSYTGDIYAGIYDNASQLASAGNMSNPYYGVATGATIMAAATDMTNHAALLYGIDNILDYRWNEGYRNYPIVLNMSIGASTGPHDGTSVVCQYLDWAEQNDGLISVIAAGNDGEKKISLTHEFTSDNEEIGTFIKPLDYPDLRYGSVEIYSADNTPLDVSVIIYNSKRGKIARTFPLSNVEGTIQYLCSANFKEEETDIVDETFSKAYEGYVGLAGANNEASDRFYAFIDYYCVNSDENIPDEETTEAQYTLGFLVKGKAGQKAYIYCDGETTELCAYGVNGYSDGSSNGTISDWATGKRVITVGSYNTSEYFANIFGDKMSMVGAMTPDCLAANRVSGFSSFGTLCDDRQLPHVIAPGSVIVSSISTPYADNPENLIVEDDISAVYDDGSRKHYYMGNSGTSMAAPLVAGAIATWLEADPSLTYEDCIEIIRETSNVDSYCKEETDPVKYGAGKFDAYAGLKKILSENGIKDVASGVQKPILTHSGYRKFNVFMPSCKGLDIKLYSMAGNLALHTRTVGNEAMIDASSLQSGIYVLTVNGMSPIKIDIK